MANPLPNEKELYDRIEKEKLSIPAPIFELLYHHIGNDVYAIASIAGLHVTGEDKEVVPVEDAEKIIKHCSQIKILLKKIDEATRHK
ncbi:MAG: hypothetical protein NTU54_01185 [Candidatus Omnitrophica bacterium]|nr:hypothetical protein [Candidatus Omnitrophota bacterium]